MRHFTLVALIFGLAAPASAQIYSWRDGNGNLVLSNRPSASVGPLTTYAVPQASAVRTTRPPVTNAKGQLYDELITEHARLNGIRTDLVRAVVQVESAFNPHARSPKGAQGLMQLMPETMRQFGVRDGYNPTENVRAGVTYLRQLLDRYKNNEELALAAYNAGPGAVDSHGRAVPPYQETRNYVAQINTLAGRRAVAVRAPTRIYRVTEVVDGRAAVRYTDQKPSTGSYEMLGAPDVFSNP